MIRLREEQQDVHNLVLGTLGQVVRVAAHGEQRGRERVEQAFLRQDAAKVVARGRALCAVSRRVNGGF